MIPGCQYKGVYCENSPSLLSLSHSGPLPRGRRCYQFLVHSLQRYFMHTRHEVCYHPYPQPPCISAPSRVCLWPHDLLSLHFPLLGQAS